MRTELSSQRLLFWREIGRFGVLIGGVLLAAYFLTVSWSGAYPRDYANYVVGRDFLNFWIYGREAWHPSRRAFMTSASITTICGR